ncbi:hypothetical protein VTK56DRAFT_2100 [Thermocarpiscus australiensis]
MQPSSKRTQNYEDLTGAPGQVSLTHPDSPWKWPDDKSASHSWHGHVTPSSAARPPGRPEHDGRKPGLPPREAKWHPLQSGLLERVAPRGNLGLGSCQSSLELRRARMLKERSRVRSQGHIGSCEVEAVGWVVKHVSFVHEILCICRTRVNPVVPLRMSGPV